jgi:hypothetical protein
LLRRIAAEGKLFAEISIRTSAKSTSAHVIHTMVTNEHTSQVDGTAVVGTDNEFVSANNLLVPYSLLLLNDYSALGIVTAQTARGAEKVNSSTISFPFNNAHYNHLTGAVNGFTPNFVTSFCKDEAGELNKYNPDSITCDVTGQNRARVRLFLAKGAADGLPDNNELYKGHF